MVELRGSWNRHEAQPGARRCQLYRVVSADSAGIQSDGRASSLFQRPERASEQVGHFG